MKLLKMKQEHQSPSKSIAFTPPTPRSESWWWWICFRKIKINSLMNWHLRPCGEKHIVEEAQCIKQTNPESVEEYLVCYTLLYYTGAFHKWKFMQPCTEQVCQHHFPTAFARFLSLSHFGNSWNTSNFFIVICYGDLWSPSLTLLTCWRLR